MKLSVNIDVPELIPATEFHCAAPGLRFNRIMETLRIERRVLSSVCVTETGPHETSGPFPGGG
jgi:hypothetical protein